MNQEAYHIAAAVYHHYKEVGGVFAGTYLAVAHLGGLRAIFANFVGVWPEGFTWQSAAPTAAHTVPLPEKANDQTTKLPLVEISHEK